MIRCTDVDRLATAYLDGELDEGRASALRGHARGCPACRDRLADEARLRDAARELEPVEAPPALWAGIEARLAAAEAADARRPRLWLWWQVARRPLTYGVVAAAAAAMLLVGLERRRGAGQAPGQVARAPDAAVAPAAPPAPEAAPRSLEDHARDELVRADQRYRATIAELRALVAEERAAWSEGQAAAYERRLAELEASTARARPPGEAGDDLFDLHARDELHRAYRAEIAFLQEAALDGVVR